MAYSLIGLKIHPTVTTHNHCSIRSIEESYKKDRNMIKGIKGQPRILYKGNSRVAYCTWLLNLNFWP